MTNSKKMNPQKLKDTLLKYALYIILLLLLVVIVAIKPNFLSVGNLISILKQASTKGIMSLGVAGIIVQRLPGSGDEDRVAWEYASAALAALPGAALVASDDPTDVIAAAFAAVAGSITPQHREKAKEMLADL